MIKTQNQSKIKTAVNNQLTDKLIYEFHKSYDKTIYLENDKDTFADFSKILKSYNKNIEFGLVYEKNENEIVSGAAFVRIKAMRTINRKYSINYMSMIIYIFTLPQYRRQGRSSNIINYINNKYSDDIWFAEVLDDTKLTNAEEEMEEKYSGISGNARNAYWYKMGFAPLDFDYYNPEPDLSNHCNGTINYNKLWIKYSGQSIKKKIILFFTKRYFKYGYCAGKTNRHRWEAYKLLDKKNLCENIDIISCP